MLGGLFSTGIGILSIVSGVKSFGCESVSFSRTLITCFSDDGGAVAGYLAGWGLILLGVVLIFVGLAFILARMSG